MQLAQMVYRNAGCYPDATAIICETRKISWSEFGDRISRLAGGLLALGVKRSDRIAILGENSPEYLEVIYAAAWIGAIAVPLNYRLADAELEAILADSGANTLYVDDVNFERGCTLKESCRSITRVISTAERNLPQDFVAYGDLLSRALPVVPVDSNGSDIVGIFYTGGTTGVPKGVMHTHDNLWLSAFSFALMVGLSKDSISLCSTPLFHVAATCAAIPALMVGGACVIMPRFDTTQVLEAIREHRVTIANFVPSMLRMLLDDPAMDEAEFSSLQSLIYGAAPMPPALLDEVQERMKGPRIHHAYGMTELIACITILPWEYNTPERRHEGRWRSAGHAILSADICIHDAEGKECPPGIVGEICARGPVVMAGYWNKPKETAQALRDGWMHTGDAGYLDEENFLFVVDRLKDMIITGGENVYCSEVEGAISLLDGVHQCAVFGVPHPKWGESVHAVIVPDPGVELLSGAVQEHCRNLIAGYKVPRSIEFRSDPLPLSAVNKILKKDLRQAYLEALSKEPE